MAGLASGRAEPEIFLLIQRRARITRHPVMVQQHKLFHARLFAESLDHLRDLRPVVIEHRVFQGGVDQLAFGKRAGALHSENAVEVVHGIEVGCHAACSYHGRRDAKRKAHRQARKTQTH